MANQTDRNRVQLFLHLDEVSLCSKINFGEEYWQRIKYKENISSHTREATTVVV